MRPGFAQPPATDSASRLGRTLEPAEWAAAGIPLLRSPREVVTGLHERHSPGPGTAVVAVLGPDERLVASASFTSCTDRPDGWQFRNALLEHLRMIVPHDLRRRSPVRTALLLFCRDGDFGWCEADGAWMWGLRDACSLHGLRCGAYIVLTTTGWQVFGEDRQGRRPHAPHHPSDEHSALGAPAGGHPTGRRSEAAGPERFEAARHPSDPPGLPHPRAGNGTSWPAAAG